MNVSFHLHFLIAIRRKKLVWVTVWSWSASITSVIRPQAVGRRSNAVGYAWSAPGDLVHGLGEAQWSTLVWWSGYRLNTQEALVAVWIWLLVAVALWTGGSVVTAIFVARAVVLAENKRRTDVAQQHIRADQEQAKRSAHGTG